MNGKLRPIRFFLLVFLFVFFSSKVFAEYIPTASYKIDVKLDVKKKLISGQEKISFLNTSTKDLDTLYLHLFPNAFSSDSTIFVKESGYLKELMKKEEYQGYLKIKTVEDERGEVSYRLNETVMSISLPEPLEPGKKIELSCEFELKLPKISFRLGYDEDNFLLCEWFPKMAVLEQNGTWRNFPNHYMTEFFSDFGTYDVSITLPLKYVIDGTGYITAEKNNPDSTKTVSFHAEKVHDFAWAASPDFKVRKVNIDGVEVVFLFLPGDLYRFPRWVKGVEAVLKYCNSHFGKYPYKKLVVANSSIGLGGAMESPMFITMPPDLPFTPENVRLDEWIIIHELVHQWWYGIVASNEAEEAWLDEGMTTYTTRKIMENEYGIMGNIIDLWGVKISDENLTKLVYSTSAKVDPIVKPSWEFLSVASYGVNVYYKTSLVLDLLENLVGKEEMSSFLKEYYNQFQFKHPKTDDFKKLAEKVTNQNLDVFFKEWFYDTKTCDYEVKKIKSEQKGNSKNKKEKLYETTVEIRRNGDIMMPVEVLIELENGEKLKENWDGKDKWVKIKLETKAKIRSAILDPENKMVLDVNVNNNGLSTEPHHWSNFKFFSDYLFWMESCIQWMVDFF
ncbi:MAG: M1 family metallopeptidase [candidate division Zixibacteria bacterium]|nr:M1 family metallopeptidase [candidate division Zixibacteria bacterium]